LPKIGQKDPTVSESVRRNSPERRAGHVSNDFHNLACHIYYYYWIALTKVKTFARHKRLLKLSASLCLSG
jgi:hypothetical protein